MADAPDIAQLAQELANSVGGVDYDGKEVHQKRVALHQAMPQASVDELAAALDVLVERVSTWKLEDADGVAYAALTAGALIENGAPSRPLAEVLLAKIPVVLRAARAYADLCIKDLPSQEEEEENPPDEEDIMMEVDSRSVTHSVFQAHLKDDRGSASALAMLQMWTLPTVAALSRDRELFVKATQDEGLRQLTRSLVDSPSHWLDVLLGAQLDAPWLALCPMEKRGFEIKMDGVVSNFDLHALAADALLDQGIPGERNPKDVIDFIRGNVPSRSTDTVSGTFQFYNWTAAGYDWSTRSHPAGSWVWGEGRPEDVPFFQGVRTLIVGPQTIQRSWGAPRTFGGLRCDVTVVRELTADEYEAKMEAMRKALQPEE